MPHIHCYLDRPALVWTMLVTDLLIGLSYFVIAPVLWLQLRKTKVRYSLVIFCFGTFIAACGLTHFMEIWTLWHADYWWAAGLKVLTAVASVGTAIYLIRLRGPISELARAAALSEKRRVELEELAPQLEAKVAERTKTLKELNEQLTASELKFRHLADSLPQMIWSSRADGHLDYYNERWYDFTGFSRAIGGDPSWDPILHPEDKQRCYDSWYAAVQTEKPYQAEYRFKDRATNSYRWFLVRALLMRNSNGAAERWFGSCTDIDGQKEAEARLAKAITARDDFLSIASHELKTPLAALMLQAQVTKRDLDRGKLEVFTEHRISDFAHRLDSQVKHLNKLVEDMLDISRIRTGLLSVDRELISLSDFIPAIIGDHSSWHPEVSITSVLAPNVWVSGDADRIRQVLSNLLTNAVKYGGGRPIEVTLTVIHSPRLGEEAADSKTARLSVRDLGIGIEPADQARIFDRFERAISENEISGLGLGLNIAKEIVLAHGGQISVESEVGKGARFFVDLPMSLAPFEQPASGSGSAS